jgi:pimeloyl-ACP methyl ester carboxylesterase
MAKARVYRHKPARLMGRFSNERSHHASRFSLAHLVEFPDLGHAPQIQAPDVFHKALLNGLPTAAAGTR